MTPQNRAQTIQIVDDGIAFTKATAAAGIGQAAAVRFAAELAKLTPKQVARICAAARQQHEIGQATAARHEDQRKKRSR